MSTYDPLLDTGMPWLSHQKVTPRPRTPQDGALGSIVARLEWAGWEQVADRRQSRSDARPAGSPERRGK
jgi:hypothetical protein